GPVPLVPRIREPDGVVPDSEPFPPGHSGRPPGGPASPRGLRPRGRGVLARPPSGTREPHPSSPRHDLPRHRRGRRTRLDRVHLLRPGDETRRNLGGPRRASAFPRRDLLLRVACDWALIPDGRSRHNFGSKTPVRVSFWIGSEERIWFGPGTTRRSLMDSLAIAAVAVFLSCLAGFAWGRRQSSRTVAQRGDWRCLVCGQRNEFELDRCWSCGRGAETTVHDPSHIPLAQRWPCPACAAWNGIARDACWRCGSVPAISESPGLPRGSRAPASRGASNPRAPRQSTGADAWKRRNS